jgi:molybdopterin/thiamine biosynthesis adenylyltransferase
MFTRHHQLIDFGSSKQNTLQSSHVCIIGCGGLGHAAATNLACSGIGTLTLIDHDTIDVTNLHRQTTYSNQMIGQHKTSCLAQTLQERNNTCTIFTYNQKLETCHLDWSLFTCVLDCVDNPHTRCFINEKCQTHHIPLVFGSAIGWYGQVAILKNACLTCLFPHMKETSDRCETRGVLGPIPNIIGTLQALECIKVCTDGNYEPNTLTLFDGKTNEWSQISYTKDPNCATCGSNQSFIFISKDNYDISCAYTRYLETSKHTVTHLFDIRVTIPEDETIYRAKHITSETLNASMIQTNSYILCEHGDRSKVLVQTLIKQDPSLEGKVFSIEGGTEAIFHV